MPQTIAYLDCHSGVSGDMFLGAMLDAGLSFERLQQALTALSLDGYRLTCETVVEKGVTGSRFHVWLSELKQPTRHLADIRAILHNSTLAEQVRDRALAVFQHLAEAEATVHGTGIEEVHFHEVGAVDAIIDIVGSVWAVEELGITQLYASPLPLSQGHVKTEHGLLPVPAPATLEILRRVSAPWRPVSAEGEMVTPTGAALLATLARFETPALAIAQVGATLARFETPALAIAQVGYGFGQKQFPWPNCLRVFLGPSIATEREAEETETDWVGVLECNIDNMTGEQFGDLMERFLAAGALDISYQPLQMKKNRPAVLVTLICRVEDIERLAERFLAETSTLGVRVQQMQRRKARREQRQIETPFGPMLVKVKSMGTRVISASPEYEECHRVASQQGVPLAEVYEVARQVIARTILQVEP